MFQQRGNEGLALRPLLPPASATSSLGAPKLLCLSTENTGRGQGMVHIAGACPKVLFDRPPHHPDPQAQKEAHVLTERWVYGLDLPPISPSCNHLSFTIHSGNGDNIVARVVYIPVYKGDMMSEQVSVAAFAVAHAQPPGCRGRLHVPKLFFSATGPLI